MAVIFILFYHCSQLVPGLIHTYNMILMGEAICQIAMVLFFAISGFGTYLYFDKYNGSVTPWDYFKRRIQKIAPQYYICMGMILLTTGTAYLAVSQIKTILAAATFTHNLFPSTNGEINGVTWTIGLFVQFYIIAPFCYRFIEKWGCKKVYAASVIITLTLRITIVFFILTKQLDPSYYVIFSIRQIYTTADIFIAGMCAAKCYLKGSQQLTGKKPAFLALLLLAGMFLTFLGFTGSPEKAQYVWGYHLRSWLWQPILGAEAAVLLWVFANANFSYSSLIGRGIQYIARNEYGIYLWHMVLLVNVSSSPVFASVLARSPWILCIGLVLFTIIAGSILNRLNIRKESSNKWNTK